jgi:transposase
VSEEDFSPERCSAEEPIVEFGGFGDTVGMFLRRKSKKYRGVGYSYWHLCETVRTARGPRQRVVASLGKLDEAEVAGLRSGWDDLPALLRGEGPERRAITTVLPSLATATAPWPAPAQWEQVDVRGLRVERTRDFGESYLGLALWHRLKLDELLRRLLPAGDEAVEWSQVAALLTVARFCGQRSELGVAEHWYDTTALDDLLGVDTALVNDARLYRALDHLGKNKDALCAHLMERYRQWFGVRFEFLLYDVTSTYFEGQAELNPQAQRGYSRDQRGDCKQVCIGLVCTPEGLPLSFEVFAGNRADVTTVEEIVGQMEKKYGIAERIWVMDRGMVSEANIAFLRARKARYLVGTPKSWLRHHEAALLTRTDWQEVQAGLEVRLVTPPDGEPGERYVLCRSAARAEKERAMLQRQSDQLAAALGRIAARLEKRPQSDLEAVGRQIGRALGKYPAAAAIIGATVRRDAANRACSLEVASDLVAGQKAQRHKGAYLLRTNCEETDPALLWRWYVQLTQAEAAFRTAKSDLGLRPVFHHKSDRVQAHILVCFLALALWRSLEQWMQAKGLGSCARQLIKEIAGIKSVDVLLPVKRGQVRTELRLRVVTTPEPAAAQLLAHLGLHLPKGPREIANVVPKNGGLNPQLPDSQQSRFLN